MHQMRVMHRDLKPANIFLTAKGQVKVGDLGLSRALSENTMQAHSKVGTPLYMSPEVLRGKGYAFKSDVWSLGCILYELAVLRSPFKEEGLSLYGLFQKISKGEYPEVPAPYSDELRRMVHRMLDVNVEKRATIDDVCNVSKKMRIITEEARRKRKELEAAKKAEEAAKKYVQKVESSSGGRLPFRRRFVKGGNARSSFRRGKIGFKPARWGRTGFEDADFPWARRKDAEGRWIGAQVAEGDAVETSHSVLDRSEQGHTHHLHLHRWRKARSRQSLRTAWRYFRPARVLAGGRIASASSPNTPQVSSNSSTSATRVPRHPRSLEQRPFC